jgi:hypothetical protein
VTDPGPRGSEPPDQTADDTDVGWGERPVDDDEALRRLLEDRPPHHGDV